MRSIDDTRIRWATTDEEAAPFVEGAFISLFDAERNPTGLYIVQRPLDDEWIAAYYIDTASGRPEIIELRVIPRNGMLSEGSAGDGAAFDTQRNILDHTPQRDRAAWALTTRLLQTLSPSSAVKELQSVARQVGLLTRAEAGITYEMLTARQARRRGPSRDLWLAMVANVYLGEVARGSTSPVLDTRYRLNEVDSRSLSTNAVRDLLAAARKDEKILTRPVGGKERRRSGGKLTELARDLLAGAGVPIVRDLLAAAGVPTVSEEAEPPKPKHTTNQR